MAVISGMVTVFIHKGGFDNENVSVFGELKNQKRSIKAIVNLHL
jgi:hypothetical protein